MMDPRKKTKLAPTSRKSPSTLKSVGDEPDFQTYSRGRSRQKDGKPPVSTGPISLNPINLMYLDNEVLSENLKQTNQLMQQHREEGNVRQMRHEQRRRKFIRQLDTSLISQTNNFFEKEVIGQLLNVSRTEQQEMDFQQDVFNYRQIILQNRRTRDQLIDEMNLSAESRARAFENVEAKREVGWVVKLDTKSQLKRRDTLQIAYKSADRCESLNVVKEFMNKLLDVVDWTINCREIAGFSYRYSNPKKVHENHPNVELTTLFLPELIWNDIRRLASSKHPFASPLPYLVQILPSTLMMPFNISQRPHLADANWILTTKFNGAYVFDQPKLTFDENSETETPQLSSFLAKQDWIDFIQELNKFNEMATKAEHFEDVQYPEFFRDAVLTPAWMFTTNPQYIAGETVIQIRAVVNPIPSPPEPNVTFDNMSLRIALFGASEVSKKTISKALTAFFPRFHSISVENLVMSAFQTTLPTEKAIEEYTPFEQLVRQIQLSLQNGESIQNDQYAQLIIQAIQALPVPNNGFVLEDYPNTKEQLLSLLQAISNIRYDEHRPQPKDLASAYTPFQPSEDWTFDIKNCGFDVFLCVDTLKDASGIEKPLREKVRARKNLFTQETVYLDEETDSVKGLQYIYDPTRPYATSGLSLTMQEREVKELVDICAKIKLLSFVPYEDFETAEEAVNACIQLLCDMYVDSGKLTEDYWNKVDEEKRLAAEAEAQAAAEAAAAAEEARIAAEEAERAKEIAAQTVADEATAVNAEETPSAEAKEEKVEAVDATTNAVDLATASSDAPAVDENPTLEAVVEKRLPVIEQNKVPFKLANILSQFWNQSEAHAALNGEEFNRTVRDLRYAAIQRRRVAMDAIYISMLRQDSRQELFNAFREDFNAIDNDLRFDPDCIMDLYLRAMQLRNEISKLCEKRYQEVQQIISKYEKDNQIGIFIYAVRCEGMFLLQNELNRFYQLIDLLFDYTKSVQTFQIHEKIANELEVLLPPTTYELLKVEASSKGKSNDSKEKKTDKGKNTGGATFAPYREVLSPYLVNLNLQQLTDSIPALGGEEVAVDPKAAKGKAKDKKGDDGSPADPFSEILKAVLEDIAKWKEGAFVVSRDLYGGNNKDERFCEAIERCIWFEAAKVEESCQLIRKNLENHIKWMEEMEKQTFIILQEIAYDRFLLELASGEEIITIIEQCIQQARPLHSLWLVTPDAMPVIDPETVWSRFESYLPDSELQRFDEFAGITRPEKLFIDRSNESFDDIPVTFFPHSVDDHTGKRPSSSPADLIRPHALRQKILKNEHDTSNTAGNTATASLTHTMSSDSYEGKLHGDKSFEKSHGGGGGEVDQVTELNQRNSNTSPGRNAALPAIKKLDRMPSYNYFKTLMPPHGYHRIQKENYLASQGRLPSTSSTNNLKPAQNPRNSFTNGPATTTATATSGNSSNFIPPSGGADHPILEMSENSISEENSVGSRSTSAPPGRRSDGSTRQSKDRSKNHVKHNDPHRDSPRNGSRRHSRASSGNKSKSGHSHHHSDRPHSGTMDAKEYEKYEADRHMLQEKLMMRREQREKEFIALGMSVPNAKLAAYNELLLDEQHAWSDFDSHHKRMVHSASDTHHSSTASLGTPKHFSK